MIAVPLIYFTLLLFFIVYKHGFDVSATIVSLYVVTSLFALLIHVFDYRPLAGIPIHFIPTLVYCLLITVCIYPFYNFNSNKIVYMPLFNQKLFDWFVYFYFFGFVIFLMLFFNDLKLILSGNFYDLRKEIYSGEFSLEAHYTGILWFIATIIGFSGNFSYIMILFFFYSISFLNKSKWFNFMAIVGSLTVVVMSIMNIDRSRSFYYVILFIFTFVLFRKHIAVRKSKWMFFLSAILLSFILFYMSNVTTSRFENSSENTNGGIITYAGQPFIYFCDFWDNYALPEVSTKFLLPATHKYILKDGNSAVEHDTEMTKKSGMETGVFYSFLGNFIVDWGQIGPFIFSMFFALIALVLLRRKRQSIASFRILISLFILITVSYCGTILYFYASPYLTIDAIILLILSNLFTPRKKEL